MGAPFRHDPALEGTSGSYAPEDVRFLLSRVKVEPTPIAEKERRIQSGETHYSEMISEERRPDASYLELFENACVPGIPRLATEIRALTERLIRLAGAGRLNPQITLCSLVRAGVPYGVLLRRDLRRLGADVAHFGVSIIRDRGLDPVAMRRVIEERPVDGIIFVDGWTGKGAIASELERSWGEISGLSPILAVVADPCGRAALCGSRDDWLIPSGILGGNVSGLISRSVLRPDLTGPDAFHGYVPLDHLTDIDLSRSFVDRVDALLERITGPVSSDPDAAPWEAGRFRAAAETAVERIAERYRIANMNRIKPGIAEATRAVLRRRPDHVLVRSGSGDPDLAALLHLCAQDGVPVVEAPELTGPYRAVTLIRRTS
ncbi:RNA binding Pelota-like protein [Gemmobacter caeni]|uniref:RNA binding Pelota-like protein n=1 Tax=Gemmobacter caeni TaxID=589035 RepID=A0A2T6B915_9RHOB|nr:cysteine protease StiP family protein [Gemmobacter caeni]PTX52570.1 RNA binding Pelota-like protein [Gemmobacter caeni]TWJ02759.1 RNA binding Pelota-like protein [Gemmobacter caeni]